MNRQTLIRLSQSCREYVYLVYKPNVYSYKIGMTAQENPFRRVREHNGHPLVVLAVNNGLAAERAVRNTFNNQLSHKYSLVHGHEWYRPKNLFNSHIGIIDDFTNTVKKFNSLQYNCNVPYNDFSRVMPYNNYQLGEPCPKCQRTDMDCSDCNECNE